MGGMRVDSSSDVIARVLVLRRRLSHGAIAGTVISLVCAIGLLLCIYPLVVGCLRCRRHRTSPSFDTENAIAGADHQRQVSSTDSLKHGTDLSHQYGHTTSTYKERNGGVNDGHDLSRQIWPREEPDVSTLQKSPTAHPPSPSLAFLYRDGEYMPESEVQNDHSGSLRGTSADYYSPSIPSEAFGMISSPRVDTQELNTAHHVPRSSSTRILLAEILGRKSGRHQTPTSHAPSSSPRDNQTWLRSPPDGHKTVIPAQNVAETSPMVHSKTLSPTTPIEPASAEYTEPADSSPTQAQWLPQASPSHPSYPEPGTVNPMDIMPASTESELRFRTAQELSALFHGYQTSLSPKEHGILEGDDSGLAPPLSSPSAAKGKTLETASSTTPISPKKTATITTGSGHDTVMTDAIVSDTQPAKDLAKPMSPGPNRLSSDLPFHGPGSTTTSSRNSPLSQVDSPALGSLNSSDFRRSVSPQGFNASPRSNAFPCHEPGCGQVFDQAYKLKHHHRYHSRDHKCPYSSCGKGFGTVTHLQRHINDRHEKKKSFHCSIHGCDYSRSGAKAFRRKDNWKRHMTMIHGMDRANLSEPVEVDPQLGAMFDA